MTKGSYGNKQYIAVEGLDKALKLAKAIMEARNCQVLIQLDDVDIYIVSWANRYDCDWDVEQFVWMDSDDYEAFLDWKDWVAENEKEVE